MPEGEGVPLSLGLHHQAAGQKLEIRWDLPISRMTCDFSRCSLSDSKL